ncbi:hypothetical protein PGT21_034746 [Puccinia graminis f. sp. tritici]|uniref:Syntrophin, gamma n=1 Tax=Puccinia graminis f. sp. tritici TaxID=56615 RepID=A0A5B0NEG8_PUCGR|nr:hypothetical protein PGT21_034746 [Puccinia graminis f. sp. tritici]
MSQSDSSALTELDSSDSSALSELEDSIDVPTSTADASSMGSSEQSSAGYPNTRSKTGLSQNNLAAFNNLLQSQADASEKAAPAKPESSCHTASSASRPRFAPPKGPRKQHRTGFRQLPGANGVVKRGRPSKKEYKLAGVEVDMYALKGVTLHGPAKSLDEVKGGQIVARRSINGRRRSSARKPSSTGSAAAIGKSASGPLNAIQEEAPALQQATMVPSQSYRDTQQMLFSSTQGPSVYNYQLGLGGQNFTQQAFPSAFETLNDPNYSMYNTDINGLSQHDFVPPPWDNSLLPDPGFQSLSDIPRLSGLFDQQASLNFAPLNPMQTLVDPTVDPNLNYASLGMPAWTGSDPRLYAYPPVGLDAHNLPLPDSQNFNGSQYSSTGYNQCAYPSGFQNFQQ